MRNFVPQLAVVFVCLFAPATAAGQPAPRQDWSHYVRIAGLECITAHADKTSHSLFKDHPDWGLLVHGSTSTARD
jgi:hypothetical protein